MRLGDIVNADALGAGKPLDGIRVLALEQMQALPYATQLLARLGADVVKIESPRGGDMGRSSLPAMTDPEGRQVGATFLRNNLSKRSICVDLKSDDGRALAVALLICGLCPRPRGFTVCRLPDEIKNSRGRSQQQLMLQRRFQLDQAPAQIQLGG